VRIYPTIHDCPSPMAGFFVRRFAAAAAQAAKWTAVLARARLRIPSAVAIAAKGVGEIEIHPDHLAIASDTSGNVAGDEWTGFRWNATASAAGWEWTTGFHWPWCTPFWAGRHQLRFVRWQQ